MATCSEVVIRAYRMGLVPLAATPTTEEQAFGLETLQSMFDTWVATGMFGRLTDVYKTAAYTAKEGERVHTSGSPTITIPSTYAFDGDAGTDRPPYDLSLIEVQDGATRNVWLYDRSAWVDLVGLTTSDDCPLTDRGLNGLCACLALEMSGPHGDPLPNSVRVSAALFKQALSYKTGSDDRPRTNEYF